MPYHGSMEVTPKLRKGSWSVYDLWLHWCPGCQEMHQYRVDKTGQRNAEALPQWTFDGNLESPTFSPSMRISDGENTDQGIVWHTTCHYNITNGQIIYHGDSPHAMKGQTIPLPDMPQEYRG